MPVRSSLRQENILSNACESAKISFLSAETEDKRIKKLNDENFGTRDKRGHWKPFGTISINPPKEIFYNPIKLIKYL